MRVDRVDPCLLASPVADEQAQRNIAWSRKNGHIVHGHRELSPNLVLKCGQNEQILVCSRNAGYRWASF
jgi:hypothetical protein